MGGGPGGQAYKKMTVIQWDTAMDGRQGSEWDV